MPDFYLDIANEDQLEAMELVVSTGRSIIGALDGSVDEQVDSLVRCLRDARSTFRRTGREERQQAHVDDVVAKMRASKWYEFWNELKADQPIRWKKHPNALYTVVDGERHDLPPDSKFRTKGYANKVAGLGLWLELRRSSGKTFFALVLELRPETWTPEDEPS